MKLWKISQTANDGFCYNSAIVAAKTELEAMLTHPDGESLWYTETQLWKRNPNDKYGTNDWVHPDLVVAEYIGTAKSGTKAGSILADYYGI